MKTLDIIRWLTVSLAALVAVIFAAGWAAWNYPDDAAGRLKGITKSEIKALREFDLRDPRGDAEKAMKSGDLRLWPFMRVDFEPGFIARLEIHFIPVGITCQDPIKPYRVAENNHPDFPPFQSAEYFPERILFSPERTRLGAFAQKYIKIDIGPLDSSGARANNGSRKDNRFRLKSSGHASVKSFRESYLRYAAAYNQRVLKEQPGEISAHWGTNLLCAAVPLVDGHQIISDTLYRKVTLIASVRSRATN